MTNHNNNKLKKAFDSLDDILERIGPFLPETPKAEYKQERQWKLSKDTDFPLPHRHNQVTSPF